MKRTVLRLLAASAVTLMMTSCGNNGKDTYVLPEMPPFPEIPEPMGLGEVEPGDNNAFPEVQLDIPIHEGPFEPSWASIEENYPGTPQWLRDSKFGIWVHFGPQSAGESGDWYSRKLYDPREPAYKNHNRRFGHPSEVGYKDVLNTWNPEKLDPEYLTSLYKKAGARFLMIQGVHCDNFDLWNSRYQPWNSVNMGPKRDLIGEWDKACRKHGMRYGVTFHNEYTWWWLQTAFASDTEGDKAGIPYDGHTTLEDGKGKWWEGYDPRLLYGVDLREYRNVYASSLYGYGALTPGIFTRHLDYCKWYATQWALRIMDVTTNYNPDFIYTDGTVQGPFTGEGSGTGYKCNAMPVVMADFYNNSLRRRGKVDVFSIIKFRNPMNGAVNTAEFEFPDSIVTEQPWIREAPIGDWYYAPGFVYDARTIVRYIIESASRDGNVAINVCLRPDGSIEDAAVQMLEKIGEWMELNGEAIYGSKAWTTLGEGHIEENGLLRKMPGGLVYGGLGQAHADFHFDVEDIRFTVGRDNSLYAITMVIPEAGQVVRIKSMGSASEHMKEAVKKVSLLGYKGRLEWKQTPEALEITFPEGADLKEAAVFKVR